jgi:hypothetical protein
MKRNLKSNIFCTPRDTVSVNGTGAAAILRKRCITTESARELLQLHDKQRGGGGSGDGARITRAQLRSAYLQAAMLCHPGISIYKNYISITASCRHVNSACNNSFLKCLSNKFLYAFAYVKTYQTHLWAMLRLHKTVSYE